ncbi:MAG TPA: hypothetical protein VGO62_09530, partial [Myxococcota bacterium]
MVAVAPALVAATTPPPPPDPKARERIDVVANPARYLEVSGAEYKTKGLLHKVTEVASFTIVNKAQVPVNELAGN